MARIALIICALALGGCGAVATGSSHRASASASSNAASGSQAARTPPPTGGFHGGADGHPLQATYGAIVWDWPGDWRLVLADRAPTDGSAVRFEDGATTFEVSVSDGIAVDATPPEGVDAHLRWRHLAGDASVDGFGRATLAVGDVQGRADDAAGQYPQRVGHAYVHLRSLVPPSDGHAGGTFEGEGEVPIVFESEPHRACRAPEAAPIDVTWTETPSIDAATGAVHGAILGHGFTARSVFVEKEGDRWWLVATTHEGIAHPGVADESVNLDLGGAPHRGRTTRPFGPGGGYMQACRGLGTTSWNSDNAYVVELTRVRLGACTPSADGSRARLGTVSGKVVVMYRGMETETAWVAGAFTDVPVVTYRCD